MDSPGHSKRAMYDPQCAMCFFDAYHLSWFQLFQFWLLCFIKSFRWTNGTKIYHVCREEAANLSAHVSSDIPSISQYTSNWPAKITNSGIQYLIINQLHKLYIWYICRLSNVTLILCACIATKRLPQKSAVAGVSCAKVVQILHQRGTRWWSDSAWFPNFMLAFGMGPHHVNIWYILIHVNPLKWLFEIEYQFVIGIDCLHWRHTSWRQTQGYCSLHFTRNFLLLKGFPGRFTICSLPRIIKQNSGGTKTESASRGST